MIVLAQRFSKSLPARKSNALLPVLINAENVSSRIGKSRGYFRSVSADRLHDFATTGNNQIYCRRGAIHHNIDHQADFRIWFPAEHPGAANLANSVVKGHTPVAALSDKPTEDLFVE